MDILLDNWKVLTSIGVPGFLTAIVTLLRYVGSQRITSVTAQIDVCEKMVRVAKDELADGTTPEDEARASLKKARDRRNEALEEARKITRLWWLWWGWKQLSHAVRDGG